MAIPRRDSPEFSTTTGSPRPSARPLPAPDLGASAQVGPSARPNGSAAPDPDLLGDFVQEGPGRGEAWLRGNTYPNRAEIGKHGGAWNPAKRAWIISPERAAQEAEFLEAIQKKGVTVEWHEPAARPAPPPAPDPRPEPRPSFYEPPPPRREAPFPPPPTDFRAREKDLDRARKLVALSSSSNPFEAEEARATATRILAKHGMGIEDLDQQRTPAQDGLGQFEDIFRQSPWFQGFYRNMQRQGF